MKRQFRAGFVDVELGDIVEIGGRIGELYDIRFVQQIRDGKAWFECRLQYGGWIDAKQVKVVERKKRSKEAGDE